MASPAGGCTATATVQSQWGQGYVVQVRVTAGGSAISGWQVTVSLPAGHQLTNHWNATVTTSGQTVTATNASHNGSLDPGQATEWGLQANRPGGTDVPGTLACTVP